MTFHSDVCAPNPITRAAFREFRIQTVRTSAEDDAISQFTRSDEPFDAEFGRPYFGIYGIDADGELEHIADRRTYADAIALVKKLAPGIPYPDSPTNANRVS